MIIQLPVKKVKYLTIGRAHPEALPIWGAPLCFNLRDLEPLVKPDKRDWALRILVTRMAFYDRLRHILSGLAHRP